MADTRRALRSRHFQALPAYFGGKRRLVPVIFSALAEFLPRTKWAGVRFLDPFLGGGSVSLQAKAYGMRVSCNDLALRSASIGRALIANSSVRITSADLASLLRPVVEHYPRLVEKEFSPSVFPRAHARFLDLALANLPGFEGVKRDLLTVFLVKWMLRCQPMSMVRGTDARAAATGDFDNVSPRRLGHYLKAQDLTAPEVIRGLAVQVNRGVFAGSGEACQQEAFDYLLGRQGDVVYLDPPYGGTTAYEREYAVIDRLLEGRSFATSSFSGTSPPLADLLQATTSIPVLLFSYNATDEAQIEALEELVSRTRRVRKVIRVGYRHLGSIASIRRNRTNQEVLIVATKG